MRRAWRERLTLPIIEICFGIYMSIFIFISLYWQFAYASVPFLCIFAGGYFYVGFSSLYVLYKMQQDAEDRRGREVPAVGAGGAGRPG